MNHSSSSSSSSSSTAADIESPPTNIDADNALSETQQARDDQDLASVTERAELAAQQVVDLLVLGEGHGNDGEDCKPNKATGNDKSKGTAKNAIPPLPSTETEFPSSSPTVATADTIKQDVTRLLDRNNRALPATGNRMMANNKNNKNDAVEDILDQEVAVLFPSQPTRVGMPPDPVPVDPHIGAFAVGGSVQQDPTILAHNDDRSATLLSAHLVDSEALHLEEEERFQRRLAETTTVAAEIREEDASSTKSTAGKINRAPIVAVAGLVLALVLTVVIVLSVTLTKEDNSTMSDRDFLLDLVAPISGSNVFENSTTPQSVAVEWLLNEDPMQLPIQSMDPIKLTERYILVVLYYSTGGETWADKLGFLSNRSICEWPNINEDESNASTTNEVDCGETGTVVKVAIESNSMNGTLPKELGYLEDLEILSFTQSNIYGTIPPEILRPSKLNLLQLGTLNLTGSLPTTFNNIPGMKLLSLYNNKLTGALPAGIFLNHGLHLETVALGKNSFNGPIPDFDTQSGLEHLWAENCLFTGTLPPSIYSQRSLSELDLSKNALHGTIAPQVLALAELEHWSMFGNHFSGTLPESLGQLESIKSLDMSSNSFTGTLPALGSLKRLENLNLATNNLEGPLSIELEEMDSLEMFSVASNMLLTGTVPLGFGVHPSLLSFSIQNTSISGGVEEAFCNQSSLLVEVSADCQAEVTCSCCTECCGNEEDCTPNLPGICLAKSGHFTKDDRHGSVCECSEGVIGGGLELFCVDNCTTCNVDGNSCVQSKGYGNTFDTNGTITSFRNEFEYVTNDSAVTTILFESGGWIGDNTPCRVSVNGTACRSCLNIRCASDFEGYTIRCDNILKDSRTFNSCVQDVEVGYLELFYWADPSMSSGCPLVLERSTAFGSNP